MRVIGHAMDDPTMLVVLTHKDKTLVITIDLNTGEVGEEMEFDRLVRFMPTEPFEMSADELHDVLIEHDIKL